MHVDLGSSSSLGDLEDIVTCYIHRGGLKDPRLLPCGHAFCRRCLDNLVASLAPASGPLLCPLCRAVCNTEGRIDLPKAWTHNRLASYIYSRRRKRRNSTANVVTSLSGQAELLRRFLQDISNTRDTQAARIVQEETALIVDKLEGVLRSIQMEESFEQSYSSEAVHLDIGSSSSSSSDVENELETTPPNQVEPPVGSDPEGSPLQRPSLTSSEIEQHHDTSCSMTTTTTPGEPYDPEREAIKMTMKKYRHYKHCYSLDHYPRKISTASISSASATSSLEGSSKLAKRNCIDSDHFFLIDPENSKLLIKNNYTPLPSVLYLEIKGWALKPYFVRVVRDSLVVSGTLASAAIASDQSGERGILARFTMSGELIAASKLYDLVASSNARSPPIGGFCTHIQSGDLFLAIPGESRVVRLCGSRLTETEKSYSFPDFSPTFVSHKRDSEELWISCPVEKQILIVNDQTGEYERLKTTPMNGAVPGHIVCTEGELHQRVLFLDSDSQDIFWVIKHGSTIEIQRILYSGGGNTLNKMDIRAIEEMSDGRILLLANQIIAVIRPKTSDARCVLL